MAEVEHRHAHHERAGQRDLEEQAVGGQLAFLRLAPAGDADDREHGDHEEDRAHHDEDVGEGHQQLRGERQLAAEGGEERLQAGQQEEHEEDHHADGDHADEERVGHRADQLALEFLLFREVGDQALEDVADVARRFAGGDEVERLAVEDLRVGAHRGGQALAFAELGPDPGAEGAQAGFLQTEGEEAERFAGGHPGADQVGHRLQERQALRFGRQQVLVGGAAFAGGLLGADGGTGLLDLDRLETAGLELAERIATRGGLDGAFGHGAGGVARGVIEDGHRGVIRSSSGSGRARRWS